MRPYFYCSVFSRISNCFKHKARTSAAHRGGQIRAENSGKHRCPEQIAILSKTWLHVKILGSRCRRRQHIMHHQRFYLRPCKCPRCPGPLIDCFSFFKAAGSLNASLAFLHLVCCLVHKLFQIAPRLRVGYLIVLCQLGFRFPQVLLCFQTGVSCRVLWFIGQFYLPEGVCLAIHGAEACQERT